MLVQEKKNKLFAKVGSKDGRPLLRWDPVTRCSRDCCVWDECQYAVCKRDGTGCLLEVWYLNHVYNAMLGNKQEMMEVLSDVDVARVGLHLMPLYHQLVRFKKEAYRVKDLVVTTRKGEMRAHPIFREIREVIREIGRELKDMELDAKWRKRFQGVLKMEGALSVDDLMRRGDPNFYDTLSED